MKTSITGIKKSSEEYKIKDTCTDVLLCVSSMWDDVKISMLSEEDFEEVCFVHSSRIYFSIGLVTYSKYSLLFELAWSNNSLLFLITG